MAQNATVQINLWNLELTLPSSQHCSITAPRVPDTHTHISSPSQCTAALFVEAIQQRAQILTHLLDFFFFHCPIFSPSRYEAFSSLEMLTFKTRLNYRGFSNGWKDFLKVWHLVPFPANTQKDWCVSRHSKALEYKNSSQHSGTQVDTPAAAHQTIQKLSPVQTFSESGTFSRVQVW